MVLNLVAAAVGWRPKTTVVVEVEVERNQQCGWSRGDTPAMMGSIFGEIRWTVAELWASASAARGGSGLLSLWGD
jgi:hypothetical protein